MTHTHPNTLLLLKTTHKHYLSLTRVRIYTYTHVVTHTTRTSSGTHRDLSYTLTESTHTVVQTRREYTNRINRPHVHTWAHTEVSHTRALTCVCRGRGARGARDARRTPASHPPRRSRDATAPGGRRDAEPSQWQGGAGSALGAEDQETSTGAAIGRRRVSGAGPGRGRARCGAGRGGTRRQRGPGGVRAWLRASRRVPPRVPAPARPPSRHPPAGTCPYRLAAARTLWLLLDGHMDRAGPSRRVWGAVFMPPYKRRHLPRMLLFW